MVGGLVQGDHIPVADQEAGQLHTPALAAAERANLGVPANVGYQAADHLADARIAGPLVFGLVPDKCPTDGMARVQGVALADRADTQATAAGHPAGVRLQLSSEQPQQTGLAVPISTDDPDACAIVDAQCHRVEYHLSRICQVYGLGPE